MGQSVSASEVEDYVFPACEDARIDTANPDESKIDASRPMKGWRTAWRRALKDAGLNIRFHDLRHTCITKLAEGQASEQTLMSIAGHLSRKMLEHYSHIRMEAKRAALDGTDIGMNVLGNVLGMSGVSTVYDAYDGGPFSIYELGAGGSGPTDIVVTSLYRHGNFDAVNSAILWNPSISVRTLPASLYLRAKPGWWPTAISWPWVGPDVAPMVGVLPAKDRSDRMP